MGRLRWRKFPWGIPVQGTPETQLYDLQQMAQQRGYEIVEQYTDRISGAKARHHGLDGLLRDARRGRFDVVLVWASDRIARSTKHFLEVLDELNRLNIEFVSFREQIDTGGPLGRAMVVIICAIAGLERNLIIERVRAGMRRAKLEGRQIGRKPLDLDHAAICGDRCRGQSLRQIAWGHRISTATVRRVLHEHAQIAAGQEPSKSPSTKPHRINGRISAIRSCHKVWLMKHLKPEHAKRIIKPIAERMQFSRYLKGLASSSPAAAERDLLFIPGTGWAETSGAPP